MTLKYGVMSSTTPEAFGDVFERFARERVRYVAIGGVAVVLHGYVRPIADLDVVIDPAPEEAERALRALVDAGFVPSLPLPLCMLTVMRLYDRSGREVDIFVRYQIPFAELWAESKRRHVGNGFARVMSLEHLLRTKRHDGRPQDLLDIPRLLALKSGGDPRGRTDGD